MSLFFRVLLCLCLIGLVIGEPEPRGRSRTSRINKTQWEKTNNKTNRDRERSGRLFSLFNIVQFNNEGCRSQSSISGGTGSTARNGTCFTSSECQNKGGAASGSCAAGFGVCCLFLISNSGGIVRQNCTYIRNPGFPMAFSETSGVQYTINKCSANVCFLRLDFETFSILGTGNTHEIDNTVTPTVGGGLCLDTFDVIGSTNQNIPQICGQNTGQHIYIDMGLQESETVTLNFGFTGTSNMRMWEIKVTQIPCYGCCHKGYSPPQGCLQYHTGLTGRFTTFNFIPTNDNHLRMQEYSVCIRQEEGFCCVQYLPCTDANSFTLDTGKKTTTGTLATPKSGHDSVCSLDYIAIPASSGICNQNMVSTNLFNKYCGNQLNPTAGQKLPAPVCDCTQPFIIDVFTDILNDNEMITKIHTVPSRGVCLTWMQIPCS